MARHPRIRRAFGYALAASLVLAGATAFGFRRARAQGRERLARYPARTADLSYGRIAYIDEGDPGAEAVLSLHGLFGGYDQGYDVMAESSHSLRVIAPSRFGYPGSDIRGRGRPVDQAEALVELLDHLELERVFVLGASAGGTAAIRFALDHPGRTKGLILYSSAMPCPQRPREVAEYVGPPRLLHSDLAMFLLSPLFPMVLSMPAATVTTMFPISERRVGADLDARVSNPDMARSFKDYPIEQLRVPVLIVQARNDRMALFEHAAAALPRFPDAVLVPFDDGGHLLAGHSEEVAQKITEFVQKHGENPVRKD